MVAPSVEQLVVLLVVIVLLLRGRTGLPAATFEWSAKDHTWKLAAPTPGTDRVSGQRMRHEADPLT